ncbi:MAG: S8 family peptidase [Theionarchaea archaeon]|nr:S8 family peptidase [Theionarchaea archaeon]MBU7019917.1 S8 family peptidase [Theionarchaea archaeon]MBU7035384.1 S8 family peptidase [Theionarchaea archaeon]MBU7039544.1 S8 family peptidase [Theionarchaea archaeon]
MKRFAAGTLIAFLLLSLYSVSAPASERVIIVFNTGPDVGLVSQYGQVHQTLHLIPAVVASLPEHAIEALSRNPHIKYIQIDHYRPYVAPPVDVKGKPGPPPEELPWGVDRIDADLAWSTSTGSGVKVAIVDTGIDMDHPDLEANIKGGFNAIAPSGKYKDPNNFDDDHGHGSHCAGIVAAVDNEIGVIGVAPEAWLYGVKVLDGSGSGYDSDIIEGIQWCVDNGIQVLSMSFGGYEDDQTFHDAIDAAWDAGLLLVAAAGNEGYEEPDLYPAGYSTAMAISAMDSDDSIIWWSNSGSEIELAAPGVGIYSTYKRGGYTTMSGTSMACPHVSGVAALVWAVHPGYTNSQVRQTLCTTAEDLGTPGWDPYYGYGLVDAQAAV